MNPPTSPKADGGFAVKVEWGCPHREYLAWWKLKNIDKTLDNVCTK
jgi:hypothetical protein